MLKAIRWPGFISFWVISLSLGLGGYFFGESLTKSILSSTIQSIHGAQTDIKSVEFLSQPFKIEVNNIQLADADKLTHDAFFIEQASFDIDLLKLFQGKTIIDQITFVGFETDKLRSTPANALAKKEEPKAKPEESKAKEESFVGKQLSQIPSLSEILENENLSSKEKLAALKTQIATSEENLNSYYKALPTSEDKDQLKTKIDQIMSEKIDSLEKAKQKKDQIVELQKEVAQQTKSIEDNIKLTQAEIKQLEQSFDEAIKAPGNDWNQLSNKYQFNEQGIIAITQTLFGDQSAQWLATANKWYVKAKPWIARFNNNQAEEEEAVERHLGSFVDFKSDNPLPNWLVREILADVTINNQRLSFNAEHLTDNQNVLGQTTALFIEGGAIDSAQQTKITGQFNRLADKQLDTFNINMTAINFDSLQLMKSDSLSLTLNKPKADLVGTVAINHGKIDANFTLDFGKPNFTGNAQGFINQQINSAFSNLEQLDLTISAKGKLNDLKITIDSDIDESISQSINKQLKIEQQKLMAKLEKQFKAYVDDQLAPLKEKQKELYALQDKFDQEKKAFEDQVASKMKEANQLVDDQKQMVQDKIDQAKADLLAEKQRLEDEAKQALMAEQQQLADEKAALEAKAQAKLKAEQDALAAEEARLQAEKDKKAAELKAKADAEKAAAEEAAKKKALEEAKKIKISF